MAAGVSTSNDPSMRYVPLALETDTLGESRIAAAAERPWAPAATAIDTARAAAAAAAQAVRLFLKVVIAVSRWTSMRMRLERHLDHQAPLDHALAGRGPGARLHDRRL